MTKEQRISLNLVHRVLDYDPITGIFVWKPWSKQFDARWAGKRAGHVNNHGYRIIYLGGEGYLAHRLAWFYHYGEWPSIAIDHQDHDRDNNAIVNLRLATPIQNIWNQLITVNTGVTKRGRYWLAAITNFGKRYYLGWFLNVEEARSAYRKAVIDTRGVFACVEIKDE